MKQWMFKKLCDCNISSYFKYGLQVPSNSCHSGPSVRALAHETLVTVSLLAAMTLRFFANCNGIFVSDISWNRRVFTFEAVGYSACDLAVCRGEILASRSRRINGLENSEKSRSRGALERPEASFNSQLARPQFFLTFQKKLCRRCLHRLQVAFSFPSALLMHNYYYVLAHEEESVRTILFISVIIMRQNYIRRRTPFRPKVATCE